MVVDLMGLSASLSERGQELSASGYAHPRYAESLAEFGEPMSLQRSGGSLLKRRVPEFAFEDALGAYPLFACPNWRGLAEDLDELEGTLVTVACVADPFGDYDVAYLRRCFPDVVTPFKEHVVIDLAGTPFDEVAPHHRIRARAALRKVQVTRVADPLALLPVWSQLYAQVIARRGVGGVRAFSEKAFAIQLSTPGLVMFVAETGGQVVGAQLWYEQGEVCHSHLAASSAEGRKLRAGFALYWTAMEYFRDRTHWLNLGAAAGVRPATDDGLGRFKRGWSRLTRPAYFCGRVLNRATYESLAACAPSSEYFPRYRRGEF